MQKTIDLNLIHTFLVVTDTLSYTKAAAQLGVTQPAISASIKRLEEASKKKLFVKNGRGIELTSTGQELLPKCYNAINIINDALSKSESLKVFCNDVSLQHLTSMDNVVLNETTSDENALYELLHNRKADLIVGNVTNNQTSVLVEEIYREPLVVICRKDHPRVGNRMDIDTFYNEKHCVLAMNWDLDKEVESSLNITLKTSQIELITSSYFGVLSNVSHRYCLGVVPLSLVINCGSAFDVKYFHSPFPNSTFKCQMAYHKRQANCLRHREIRESVKRDLVNAKSTFLEKHLTT
ncbi:LysR family transcriptional regulator [Vibrio parahaemolyticus]|uniref:LysR family transcriptional regulator n=1 Tax=Vibrio parahaemolyticus TaxID=670 RepID=UPI00193FC283|nr:LysR family transcriptional regulator [Vibrio parahaemolyticus]EGQ7974173.1 LysR family transcriptional regulator [Vibrio parahaemolyticus]EGR1556677.1 LysR family transcriptional regulator [Vibrio parahaemolyticus]EGR1577960.1 LysR family transcriptional regulator [Vibrio parahaemolyticus]EJG0323858.1 LysR family transcriptional regulator [Vibrio parahaemolyticus]MBE4201862.1 LysR family transcriptional regulator [Vibrio parahaemolyticus]